jgi:hypothetical protein
MRSAPRASYDSAMAQYTWRGAISAWVTAMSVCVAALAWACAWWLWWDGPRGGAVVSALIALPLSAVAAIRMRHSLRRTDEPPIFPPT